MQPTLWPLAAILTDKTLEVRKAYIAWKNPPLVTLGAPQTRADIKPRVPVFGRDFIRVHYTFTKVLVGLLNMEHNADDLVSEVVRLGGNCLGFSAARPFWQTPEAGKDDKGAALGAFITEKLIPAAHSRGIAVEIGCPGGGCPVESRDRFAEHARRVAAAGADIISLLDEFGFTPGTEKAKARFREQFGADLPKGDYLDERDRLKQAEYQNLFLFRMNEISELVRAMAQAAREGNPNNKVFHVTSPNNLVLGRQGYHDLETQSSSLDFTNADLYSSNLDFVKYHTKYIRGAMGNNKPVLTVFSIYTTGGAMDPAETELEVWLQLLWGSNSLWGFSLSGRRYIGDGPLLAARNAYNLLQHSGLGDVLATARPVRFAGVLRDRDAFLGSLRRGETEGGGYEGRLIQPLVWALRNVPVDIVFGKYLPNLKGDGYRVLIVPDNPDMSAASAAHLKQYVEAGGNLIVEAAGARNSVIQEMAGVRPKQAEAESPALWRIEGKTAPLEGMTCDVRGKRIPVDVQAAKVLATLADGSPAFTHAKYGNGSVIYCPVEFSSSASRSSNLADVLKALMTFQAGPPPLKVGGKDVDANLLVNGERNVLIAAVYNHSREEQEVRLSLSKEALGLPDPCRAVEFISGQEAALRNGNLSIELRPQEVKFWVLGKPDKIPLPKAECPPVSGIAYSAQPGMKFFKAKVPGKGREGPKSLQEAIQKIKPEDALKEEVKEKAKEEDEEVDLED